MGNDYRFMLGGNAMHGSLEVYIRDEETETVTKQCSLSFRGERFEE